jgi:hypothetical protein
MRKSEGKPTWAKKMEIRYHLRKGQRLAGARSSGRRIATEPVPDGDGWLDGVEEKARNWTCLSIRGKVKFIGCMSDYLSPSTDSMLYMYD